MWKVTATKKAVKQLERLPSKIRLIYALLVEDLEREGPMPYGWESKPLKSREEVSIRLNREYRVLIVVQKPNLIVITVAHRKEVYEL